MVLNDEEDPIQLERTVDQILKQFYFDNDRARAVSDRVVRDYRRGLKKETNHKATIKMLPTYVTNTPTGRESGTYLALDLGGTNFRVLLIKITPGDNGTKAKCEIDSRIYKVPGEIMRGTGVQLWDHIANCIANFVKLMDITVKTLPIGFTFSFPCLQRSLTKAKLLYWTKGFAASDCEGKDIDQKLIEAVARNKDLAGYDIRLAAICNDTVGTLMSCAFEESNCKIGLIIGTGTNACYIENTKNIEMLDDDVRGMYEHMIINCEWGNFASDGILSDVITEFDTAVDKSSPNTGSQIYEKMISGMYLGELVRLVLVRLHSLGLVFYDEDVETLQKPGSIDTSFLSLIKSAAPDDIVTIQNQISSSLEIGAVKYDCDVVYKLCQAISSRAATLCACGIVGLVELITADDGPGQNIVCGVDGTVFRMHPTFAKNLVRATNMLLPKNTTVDYVLSHDGSGKGAALTALTAQSD